MSKRRPINTILRDKGVSPTGKPHTVRMDSRGRAYGIMDNGEWRRITITQEQGNRMAGTVMYKGEKLGIWFEKPRA